MLSINPKDKSVWSMAEEYQLYCKLGVNFSVPLSEKLAFHDVYGESLIEAKKLLIHTIYGDVIDKVQLAIMEILTGSTDQGIAILSDLLKELDLNSYEDR